MPNDEMIFLTVSIYIFIFIILFVASVVVPADDIEREKREDHWTGRVRGVDGSDLSPAVVFLGSTTETD